MALRGIDARYGSGHRGWPALKHNITLDRITQAAGPATRHGVRHWWQTGQPDWCCAWSVPQPPAPAAAAEPTDLYPARGWGPFVFFTRKETSMRTSLKACHLLAATALAFGLAGTAMAESMPTGIPKSSRSKSSIAEETFQTELVMKALEALGCTVKTNQGSGIPHRPRRHCQRRRHLHGRPLEPHARRLLQECQWRCQNSRKGVYSDNAAQGYRSTEDTADQYKITNIGQFKDPKSPSCLTPTATART